MVAAVVDGLFVELQRKVIGAVAGVSEARDEMREGMMRDQAKLDLLGRGREGARRMLCRRGRV